MRLSAALVTLLALGACASAPPARDVFVPPYAEKGCWARVYAAPELTGAVRQLEGPVFVEALHGAPVMVPGADALAPQPQFSEMRSLELGPHARLSAFAETLFRQPAFDLAPGARVPDLARFRFQSFALACAA